MSRSTFLALGLTAAGSLASAHLLGVLILPPPPKAISLELIAPPSFRAQPARVSQAGVRLGYTASRRTN